jgi:hypothetical protein
MQDSKVSTFPAEEELQEYIRSTYAGQALSMQNCDAAGRDKKKETRSLRVVDFIRRYP